MKNYMKLTIVFLFLFFCKENIFAQSMDCSKFKDGTYKIVGDDTKPTIIIVRKGKQQIEREENSKEYSEFKVKWVSDCVYTLTPTKATQKQMPYLPKNATITVTINEVKENSYIQTSTSNFADFKIKSEVVKMD